MASAQGGGASIQRVGFKKFVVRLKGGRAQGASPSPAPGAGGDAPPLTARERLLKEADDFAYFGALGLPGSVMVSPLREAPADTFAAREAPAPVPQPTAAASQQQQQQPALAHGKQAGAPRKRASHEAVPSEGGPSADTGADSEGPHTKRRKTAAAKAAANAKPPASKAAAKKAAAGTTGSAGARKQQQHVAPLPSTSKPAAAAGPAPAAQQPPNHKQQQQQAGPSGRGAGHGGSSEPASARATAPQPPQQQRSRDNGPSPAAAAAPAPAAAASRPATSPGQEAASAPSAGPSRPGKRAALALPGLFADICPPGAPPPAAAALAGLPLPPVQGGCAGGSRPPAPTREALDYLMAHARKTKHQGDGRFAQAGRVWDVFGLSQYALAVVCYLEYADAIVRAHAAGDPSLGTGAGEPHDASPQRVSSLLNDTAKLAFVGASACSGVRGPELAKQALVLLLERLQAIAYMRSLAAQQDKIAAAAQRMRGGSGSGGAAAAAAGGFAAGASPAASAAQLQCRPPAPLVAPAPGGGGARGPSGKPSGPSSKASDDSNASSQTLPGSGGGAAAAGVGGGHGSSGGAGGAAPPSAAAVAVAAARAADEQRLLLRSVGNMLRMTEVMHSAVLRLQQFMECPEVQASVPARQAGVHMAALGMDAGAYSVTHLAAHARGTVKCIVQLLRSAQR